MKNLCYSFSVLVIVFVFSGCTKNEGTGNEALVMFVNGCSGTNAVDVRVNGAIAAASGAIEYFSNSGYQYLTANSNLNIDYYLLNQGTLLTSSTCSFTQGYHYTVFAGGLVTGPSFVVTTDNFPTLTSGKAAVRFINLSSDSLNESFSVGSPTLDSNIGYTTCTPYFEIPSTGGTTVTAIDPMHTSGPFVAELTNQAFSAGKIYTIMLTGSSTATSGSQGVLKLTVINNN